jgi:hypothetical protein
MRFLTRGGLVDGPVYKDINGGLKFADFGTDRLARFLSEVGVHHDVFADLSTNEPIIDGTVSSLLLPHVWAERVRGDRGTNLTFPSFRGRKSHRLLAASNASGLR